MTEKMGGAVMVALCVCAIAITGCRFGQTNPAVSPQQAKEAAEKLKACAQTKTVTNEDGIQHERPLTAPELVLRGNAFRDAGLGAASVGVIGAGDTEMLAAADCYGRAIQLSPDNFHAVFGLGVVSVARAKAIKKKTDRKRETLLGAAKRQLGFAFALRKGHLEPLYYLAEVAVLEEDFSRAKQYLEVLKKRGVKAGPVEALSGYMAEVQGADAQAQIHYEAAVAAGWPFETLTWANAKVKK